MDTLKRSKDRKVTNLVSLDGNRAKVANTFGLPAGKKFSCPGATSICEKVCYAGKLEKLYKGVSGVLLHNWELLSRADHATMVSLISQMIGEFRKDCEKEKAEKLFRIHWDGDFFSDEYANAWKVVIKDNPDITFWVYTRTESAVHILKDIENLALYFSTDSENISIASSLADTGVKLAFLSDTFEHGLSTLRKISSSRSVKCPENAKKIPLISPRGSACVVCSVCVHGKADVVFSSSKK
jgi:hypothetical protein